MTGAVLTRLPIEAHWTLNSGRRRGANQEPWTGAAHGYVVTAARTSKRYGIGDCLANRATRRLHRPRFVRALWRRSQLVAIAAVWACGGKTHQAVFTDDPMAPGTTLCPRCAALGRPQANPTNHRSTT